MASSAMESRHHLSKMTRLEAELDAAKLKIAFLEQLCRGPSHVVKCLDTSVETTTSEDTRTPRELAASQKGTRTTDLKAWPMAYVGTLMLVSFILQ